MELPQFLESWFEQLTGIGRNPRLADWLTLDVVPQPLDQGLGRCGPKISLNRGCNRIVIVRVPPYVPYAAVGHNACPRAIRFVFERQARSLIRDFGAQVALKLLPGCLLVLPRLRSVRIVGETARLRFDDRAPARQIDVGGPVSVG